MNTTAQQVIVYGGFDDIRSSQLRFLEEASKLGAVTVLLWGDEDVRAFTGRAPTLPANERVYFLKAIRYVADVNLLAPGINPDNLPPFETVVPSVWVDLEGPANPARELYCRERSLPYRVIESQRLQGYPIPEILPSAPGRKKVLVTGCYDWFHSGHIRFFEEVSSYGDLYVVVGHDANIRTLKGEGHPMLSQEERRYFAQSIRYVKQALISTGEGWLDADPEIRRIRPDFYAVNEDGDRGGKREYCAERGIQYVVLKRVPAPGLPKRSSTELRGF